MEVIVSSGNMKSAWKRVRGNRGAPGVDGISVEAYPDHARVSWPSLKAMLLDGTYTPAPVRRVLIPKRSGGQRELGIPTVQDRLIQQAVLQVLTPMFDPTFSDSSFGFRPGRSAHGAVKQVKALAQAGYKWAADLDISQFFDRVNHDVLMRLLGQKIRDRRLLQLIGRFLRAGHLSGAAYVPRREGTPQGGPLSPLLANVLLHELDSELERRGLRFARYADDVLILVKSPRAAHRVMSSVQRWLREHLRLELNETKSRADRLSTCTFLGFVIRRGRIAISPDSKSAFKGRVRELTNRNRGRSFEVYLRELNAYVSGWTNYFALSETLRDWRMWDEWIRRRLRLVLLKHWKKPKTRFKRLLELGAPRSEALKIRKSRSGLWRLSKTPVLNRTLSTRWFEARGLFGMEARWHTLAPLRRTA